MGPKKVPYIVTHDGRTIRFPHPDIKKNDTIKLNLKTGDIMGHFKFELGVQVIITGGNNIGRVGTISKEEKNFQQDSQTSLSLDQRNPRFLC